MNALSIVLVVVLVGSGFHSVAWSAAERAYTDDTFKDAGAFGLRPKPNNVTYFDDLRASVVNP
jgi:hypothetical protein